MTRGRIAIFIAIIVLVIFRGYHFYFDNYSDKGILENVTSRTGYTLNLVKESESVEFFIEPEWVPFNEDEKKELDIVLTTKNNTNIILTEVWNRGNDIYFSFDTSYNMDYNQGTFMYNGLFNEDGTFSTFGIIDAFDIHNLKNEKVEVGQTGRGPNSAFSFGINPENYELIKDGFNVDYSGFLLYEYYRN